MADVQPEAKDASENAATLATSAAGLRYVIVAGLTYAVGRGYIDAGDVEGIAAGLIALGTAGYGLYKTWRGRAKLKTATQRLM
jgi:hypothetical protein